MSDNWCYAQLGDVGCIVPRNNKRHMESPERHANGDLQWDDDAPGAQPHPVTREVAHYREVVADLRAHLALGYRDDNGECVACAADGFPGIPYPCATLAHAGHGDCVPSDRADEAYRDGREHEAYDRDGEVMELRAERDRYREAIEQHRRAKTPKTLEAKRFYGLPSFADSALWDALPVDAEQERQ